MEILCVGSKSVSSAAIEKNSFTAVTAHHDGRIENRNIRSGTVQATRTIVPSPSLLRFSPCGDFLVAGFDGVARVMTNDLCDIAAISLSGKPTCVAFFGAGGRALAVGCDNGSIELINNFSAEVCDVASLQLSNTILSICEPAEGMLRVSLPDQVIDITVETLSLSPPRSLSFPTAVSIACSSETKGTALFSDGVMLHHMPDQGDLNSIEINQICPDAECVLALSSTENPNQFLMICQNEATDAEKEAAVVTVPTTTDQENTNAAEKQPATPPNITIEACKVSIVDQTFSGEKLLTLTLPAAEVDRVEVGRGIDKFIFVATQKRVLLVNKDFSSVGTEEEKHEEEQEHEGTEGEQDQNNSTALVNVSCISHQSEVPYTTSKEFEDLLGKVDVQRAENKHENTAGTNTQRKIGVDVSFDTGDIDHCREKMDVYVFTRIVGDGNIKEETRYIALPSTSRANEVIEKLETLFDRRLLVSFVNSAGRLVELRPSTIRIFESIEDDEKQLYCRSLFPQLSRSQQLQQSHRAATPNASLLEPTASSSQRHRSRAQTPAGNNSALSGNEGHDLTGTSADENSSSLQERKVLSRKTEEGMVARLYRDSQVERLKKQLKLQEKHLPTSPPPTITKNTESNLLSRLTQKSVKKERSLNKSRQQIEQEAQRPAPKKMEPEEESEWLNKFYSDALKREEKKRENLDKKLFHGKDFKKLKKDEWKEWEEKMKRPIKQNFREKEIQEGYV